eukprot:gene14303-14426_t
MKFQELNMPSIITSDYKAGGFRLTGWRVLGIFFLFFGSIMSVNMLMVYYALSTHRGEIADHPYEVGLAYNKEITAARAQDQRNWAVDVTARRDTDGLVNLDVAIKDAGGKPLEALTVTSKLQAPADMRRDIVSGLVEDAPGHYHGKT